MSVKRKIVRLLLGRTSTKFFSVSKCKTSVGQQSAHLTLARIKVSTLRVTRPALTFFPTPKNTLSYRVADTEKYLPFQRIVSIHPRVHNQETVLNSRARKWFLRISLRTLTFVYPAPPSLDFGGPLVSNISRSLDFRLWPRRSVAKRTSLCKDLTNSGNEDFI